ncbi:hypothetical protein IAQ61_009510, partial [Plenodomus lingam]
FKLIILDPKLVTYLSKGSDLLIVRLVLVFGRNYLNKLFFLLVIIFPNTSIKAIDGNHPQSVCRVTYIKVAKNCALQKSL